MVEEEKGGRRIKTTRLAPALLLAALLSCLVAVAVTAAGQNPARGRENDFVQTVYVEGLWKAEAGSIAARQAASGAVRGFGEVLARHYGLAVAALKAYADKSGRPLSKDIDQLQGSTLKHLAGLRGAPLDREYINLMVSELERDVAIFRNETGQDQEPELRSLARHMTEILGQDLTSARDILKDLPYSGYSAPSQPR